MECCIKIVYPPTEDVLSGMLVDSRPTVADALLVLDVLSLTTSGSGREGRAGCGRVTEVNSASHGLGGGAASLPVMDGGRFVILRRF